MISGRWIPCRNWAVIVNRGPTILNIFKSLNHHHHPINTHEINGTFQHYATDSRESGSTKSKQVRLLLYNCIILLHAYMIEEPNYIVFPLNFTITEHIKVDFKGAKRNIRSWTTAYGIATESLS